MPTLPPLVTLNIDVPDEEETSNKSKVGRVEVPCIDRVTALVVVPKPKEPLALTLNNDTPVEELIWKGFKVVVPWTKSETVAEEALTPVTVPLSIIVDVAKAVAEVNLAT